MIHPTALVSPKAVIGDNVKIGAYSIIHDKVEIGANSEIDSYCEIGYPTPLAEGKLLKIGSSAKIRSHSVFYEGSEFGERLITGHRVTVRELTKAGKNLQIGTQSDIQGTCEFGDYVRIHSNVFVGQLAKLGNFVWLFPYVVLTNDPHPPSNTLVGVTIEDFAAVAAKSVILPGIRLGEGCLIAAGSVVNRNVQAHRIYAGVPAKDLGETSKIKLSSDPSKSAYPWTQHFHRGYPSEIVEQWRKK